MTATGLQCGPTWTNMLYNPRPEFRGWKVVTLRERFPNSPDEDQTLLWSARVAVDKWGCNREKEECLVIVPAGVIRRAVFVASVIKNLSTYALLVHLEGDSSFLELPNSWRVFTTYKDAAATCLHMSQHMRDPELNRHAHRYSDLLRRMTSIPTQDQWSRGTPDN